MRRFRFIYDLPASRISIAIPYGTAIGKLDYELPSATGPVRLLIGDQRGQSGENRVHRRLLAQLDVSGDAIDVAEQLASQVLAGALCMAVLQTNAAAGDPYLLLGWEVTPGTESVEFLQVDRELGTLFVRKRAFDDAQLQEVIRSALACAPKMQSRLNRALHWYSKGLAEGDAVDQFMSFWVGLEALNPLLETTFQIPRSEERCPTCNRLRQDRSSLGIRATFEHHSRAKLTDYNTCRRLRSDIEHSNEPLTKVYPAAQQAVELARAMLRAAILVLLDLPVTVGDAAIYGDHHVRVEYRITFHTTPEALPEVPILDTSGTTYNAELVENVWKIQIKWNIRSNASASYTPSLVVITPEGIAAIINEIGPT